MTRALLQSFVFIGALFFCLLDLSLRLAFQSGNREHNPLGFSPLRVSHRSWVYWNYKDLVAPTVPYPSAPLAVYGSSLMMAALHGGDAAYTGQSQNVVLHHRSSLLRDLTKAATGKDIPNFAFALGGEMASDAYVLLCRHLDSKEAPRTVIYGIAPRDFSDNSLPSLASTEIYKYAERLSDLGALAPLSRVSIPEKAEYLLSRISFIYGHREDLIYLQQRYARQLASRLFGYKNLDLNICPTHIRQQAFLELPEDCAVNEGFVAPPGPGPEPFVDNSAEYKNRYKKINQKQYLLQMSFLARIAVLCKERGVNLVVVNMPLTRGNIALLKDGFYQNYIDDAKKTVEDRGGVFLDARGFVDTDFADSVHLNTRGGKKFFEYLVRAMTSHEKARHYLD